MKISTNAVLLAGSAVVLYWVVTRAPRGVVSGVAGAVADAGTALGVNPAPGSVYEGHGVVGGVGNLANQASGGLFERAGSWIGGRLADLRGY